MAIVLYVIISLPPAHNGKPGSTVEEFQPLNCIFCSVINIISSSFKTKMKAPLKLGHWVTLDYQLTEKPF